MLVVALCHPPEPISSAVSTADVAQFMGQRGHEVQVLCPFPNRPQGRRYEGFPAGWRHNRNGSGYRITHCWSWFSRRSTLASRLAENLSFGLSSSLEILRGPRPDVVYLHTWPLFAQWLNTLVLSWLRVPVLLVIRDLYPESYLAEPRHLWQGIFRLAVALDRQVHRRSALVAPITHEMREHIAATRGVEGARLWVMPEWLDGAEFEVERDDFRQRQGWSDHQLVALFVGSFARTADMGIYLQAAEYLKEFPQVQLALVGGGVLEAELQAEIERRGLDNLRLITPLARADVARVQAAADVLMLSLQAGQARHALPSKLIAYMFSGRPVVAALDGRSPAALELQRARCGEVVAAGDGKALAHLLQRWSARPEPLIEMGLRARSWAQQHYSRGGRLAEIAAHLEALGHR